jgi:hypothetical protein
VGGEFAENGQQSNMWFICLEMVPLSPLKFALGLVYFDCSLPRSSEGIRGKGNKTKQNKTKRLNVKLILFVNGPHGSTVVCIEF